MSFLPEFRMRITKVANSSKERSMITSIVIQRPYAHLEKELRRGFKGDEDVKVILDGRYRQRRKRKQPVKIERRRADQRRSKEYLVEVVISTRPEALG